MDPRLTWMELWPYYFIHATRMAEGSMYSLDPPTRKRLGRIARRWRVSRAEALRLAVLHAEQAGNGSGPAHVARSPLTHA